MGEFGILLLIIAFVGGIFIMRMIGAWMLRIDEVIKELQEIKKELKAQNNPIEQKAKLYDEKNKPSEKPKSYDFLSK